MFLTEQNVTIIIQARKMRAITNAEVFFHGLPKKIHQTGLNNPQIREEYQNTEMQRQKFYEMTEVVEILSIKEPISQMNWMMNDDLTDEENQEEMMNCKTLEELISLIAWNIVFNLDMAETKRMADLDRTVSGYND